jgi:hypothetical protein
MICEFDAETGACPAIEVAEDVRDSTPQLSGNRLVWDGQVGDEAGDVFFCEYDSALRRCPVQRLTAEMAVQGESDIDGPRVVWRDERAGPSTIFGTTLPHFAPVGSRDRQVRSGRRLEIRVRAEAGSAGETKRGGRNPETDRLRLDVEAHRVNGAEPHAVDLASLRVRFEDRGEGRGRLRWRPRTRHAGDWVFTFEAHTEGGLVSRESIRVHVEADPERGGHRRGRGRGRGRGGASRH